MEDIVTIDGPTSSGKNSVGHLLAQKLGYQYIDTGMIYRFASKQILENNILLEDKEKILEVFKALKVDFKAISSDETLLSPQISKIASDVAAMAEVRGIMKQLQRKIAASGKIIMGGRDIGSEIFPEAKHKFFLTASPEVRASRRFSQLIQTDPAIKYEDVLRDLKERDEKDMTREASPLRVPEDAVVLDTTNLSIEQTVEEMLKYIHNVIPAKAGIHK